jgi:hypothetical protein
MRKSIYTHSRTAAARGLLDLIELALDEDVNVALESAYRSVVKVMEFT